MKYTKVEVPGRVLERPEEGIDILFGRFVSIPRILSASQESWVVKGGKRTRTFVINPALAHIINSQGLEGQARIAELKRGLHLLDLQLSDFIKENILQKKFSSGYMSFAQIYSFLGRDEVFIDTKTYQNLCKVSKDWINCSTVAVQRYPNLGPKTTSELKLIVGDLPEYNSLLAEFMKISPEFNRERVDSLFAEYGPIFLNPATLKENFEGDCDGDLLYLTPLEKGSPVRRVISPSWQAADIEEKDIATMLSKARRSDRTKPIVEYLPTFIDRTPIGPATYAVRYKLYKASEKYKTDNVPYHQAWKEVSGWAIELIEFVMDIRKGEFTPSQVDTKINQIAGICRAFNSKKRQGDWFCKIALANEPIDITQFVKRFNSLNDAKEEMRGR